MVTSWFNRTKVHRLCTLCKCLCTKMCAAMAFFAMLCILSSVEYTYVLLLHLQTHAGLLNRGKANVWIYKSASCLSAGPKLYPCRMNHSSRCCMFR